MLLLQLFPLIVISFATAQDGDESFERGDYNSESGERPDFSKYYSVEGNAPPTQFAQNRVSESSGFVTPTQFSTFFAPAAPFFKQFDNEQLRDASNSNGVVNKNINEFNEYNIGDFGVQDFFEQAQNSQRNEKLEVKPLPSADKYRQQIKVPNSYSDDKEIDDEEESNTSEGKFQNDFRPTQLPQYSTSYTKVDATPYEKYSFQPAVGYSKAPVLPRNPSYPKINVDDSPREYQPSESVPQRAKDQNCSKLIRMVSDGKSDKKPMTCYVCIDSKTGGKQEKCSYNNEPNPKSYYHSTSYGTPDNYRHKREELGTFSNPYEEIKATSHSYNYKPTDFDKEYYKSPDFSGYESYKYAPKGYSDNDGEKSNSEIQSEQLIKDNKNCRKTLKDGVTCTICKDAKTGANFEQCSYESQPDEKKYAYLKEKKYDSNDDSEDNKEEDRAETRRLDTESKETPNSAKLHSNEASSNKKRVGDEEEEEDRPLRFQDIDSYHRKLFPRLIDEESKIEEKSSPPNSRTNFGDVSGKRDVERVLSEFAKKDRTNCKQISKKGMTCYICVDENGVQNEECMYVSESRPVSTHVAYHNVKRLRNLDPKPENAEKIERPKVEAKQNQGEVAKAVEAKKPDRAKVSERPRGKPTIKRIGETSSQVKDLGKKVTQ